MDTFHFTPFQGIIPLKYGPRFFAPSYLTPFLATKIFFSTKRNVLNLQCTVQCLRVVLAKGTTPHYTLSNEECRLLGYKTPVRTSKETHYVSTTEISRLMIMWDLRFSRRWLWRMWSSGMLRRVDLVRTDVSQELSPSFIRVTRICEIGTTLAVTINRRTLRKIPSASVASYI
jgi:hypothetical protein